MADTKVSDLNSITVAGNNDILYIVNPIAGTSNKITYQNLLSGVNDSITSLTSDVNTYTTTVLELSSEFQAANLDIGPLQSDVLQLSGDLDALSAAVFDIEDASVAAKAAIDFLSGAIDLNTSDVLVLSTQVAIISAELDSRPEGVTDSFVIASSTFTFLSGQLTSVTI